MRQGWLPLGVLLAGLTVFSGCAHAAETVEGWLTLQWGDGGPESPGNHRRVSLTDDTGQTVALSVSDELLRGGVFRWNGQRVRVYAPSSGARFSADGAMRVRALEFLGQPSAPAAVTGSQPWISIPCKFADIADEPEALAFFEGMYANQPGGLDHFWREVSYGTIDVVGSIAVDWVTLPGVQTDYVPTPGSGTDANLNKVFDDCTAAVDDIVDFSGGGAPLVGINIMLNGSLDCCAWGGGRFATLDGVTKSWRTTWNPPWSFANEGIIAHEMGHGFGLPHANNFDDDGNPYDSPWDVMSAATGYAASDPTYGALGKHVNAWHKDKLGWFAPDRRFEAMVGEVTSIELDHTALANATHYQMALLSISADSMYTVEARMREGLYDSELAGDAVIIHEVRLGRSEPAWAVDADMPPANYGDNPGTMWQPGETFADFINDVRISIDYATDTGFGVTIDRRAIITLLSDGFE